MEALAPDWSELPTDILCNVLKLLECPDLLRSATVCSIWYKAYSRLRQFSACPGRQIPCLLYCTEAAGGVKALGMYSLSEGKAYTMQLPEHPIRNWIGSSHGWLVTMDDRSELMLLNPITGDKIALPPVTTMEHVKPILNGEGILENYEVFYYDGELPRVVDEDTSIHSLEEYGHIVYLKATLSCDPSVGECIVMLIHQPYGQLSFAKVGDVRWNWLEVSSYYKDCIYHDGWFYVVTEEGAIDAYNLHESSVIHKRLLPQIIEMCSKFHIVQAQWGDVLQIIRDQVLDPDSGKWSPEIKVYRVDFDKKKCVNITGIGDYALFVGSSTTSCLSVKDYPDLMPNHVYFTDDDDEAHIFRRDDPPNIGIYDIENNTTTSVVCPELWMSWLPPIWLTPSLSKTGFQDHNGVRRMEAIAPDWSELPTDILCNVLKLLECPDLLRSAAVCSIWYEAYSRLRQFSACPGRQIPCLLYCTEAAGGVKALGMCSLSERKAYTMPLPEHPIRNWIGSSHGWLVTMDDRSDLMLLNPPVTTMEHVKPIINGEGILENFELFYYDGELPRVVDEDTSIYSLEEYGHMVYLKATLSCDPSVGECIVMLIHQPYGQLSFAKVGDVRWNWLEVSSYYKDCIYHNGWFYAVTEEGEIDAYNLHESTVIHKRFLPKIIRTCSKFHIVRAQWGDVLQIIRNQVRDLDSGKWSPEIKVYRVDFDKKKCANITGIGDYALFIGSSRTSCLSVKDYPDLMLNHVYFTDDDDEAHIFRRDDPPNIGIYDIENNTTTSVVCPELWMAWLTPSLPKTGFQDHNGVRR